MYEVKIVTQFAAAHRLENFNGKCEGLHGHNWKVEVFLVGPALDQRRAADGFWRGQGPDQTGARGDRP